MTDPKPTVAEALEAVVVLAKHSEGFDDQIDTIRAVLEASRAEVERLKARLQQHEGRYDTQGLLRDEAPAATSAELAAAEHAVVEAALSWHAVPADTGAAEKALDDCCERVSRLRSRT